MITLKVNYRNSITLSLWHPQNGKLPEFRYSPRKWTKNNTSTGIPVISNQRAEKITGIPVIGHYASIFFLFWWYFTTYIFFGILHNAYDRIQLHSLHIVRSWLALTFPLGARQSDTWPKEPPPFQAWRVFGRGGSSVAERLLRMQEVPGSIPGAAYYVFLLNGFNSKGLNPF